MRKNNRRSFIECVKYICENTLTNKVARKCKQKPSLTTTSHLSRFGKGIQTTAVSCGCDFLSVFELLRACNLISTYFAPTTQQSKTW